MSDKDQCLMQLVRPGVQAELCQVISVSQIDTHFYSIQIKGQPLAHVDDTEHLTARTGDW